MNSFCGIEERNRLTRVFGWGDTGEEGTVHRRKLSLLYNSLSSRFCPETNRNECSVGYMPEIPSPYRARKGNRLRVPPSLPTPTSSIPIGSRSPPQVRRLPRLQHPIATAGHQRSRAPSWMPNPSTPDSLDPDRRPIATAGLFPSFVTHQRRRSIVQICFQALLLIKIMSFLLCSQIPFTGAPSSCGSPSRQSPSPDLQFPQLRTPSVHYLGKTL